MSGERLKHLSRVVVLGAVMTGGAFVGSTIDCGENGKGQKTPDVPTPIAGKVTSIPVETTTPTIDPELAAQLKNACTPGIDTPIIPETELAGQKVTRKNAVQFLSTGGIDFSYKQAEVIDPNLDHKEYLITCKIPLGEGTRFVGLNLDAVDSQGKKQTVENYDQLVNLLSAGGSEPLGDTAARALPFFNQKTFPYVKEEVDGEKPEDGLGLTYVRLKRVSGNMCEEAIYAVRTTPNSTDSHKVGDIIDQGRAIDGACKTQ